MARKLLGFRHFVNRTSNVEYVHIKVKLLTNVARTVLMYIMPSNRWSNLSYHATYITNKTNQARAMLELFSKLPRLNFQLEMFMQSISICTYKHLRKFRIIKHHPTGRLLSVYGYKVLKPQLLS